MTPNGTTEARSPKTYIFGSEGWFQLSIIQDLLNCLKCRYVMQQKGGKSPPAATAINHASDEARGCLSLIQMLLSSLTERPVVVYGLFKAAQ